MNPYPRTVIDEESGATILNIKYFIWKDGHQAGLEEGITLYAWWKDGVQYVGTTGRTLKKALEEGE